MAKSYRWMPRVRLAAVCIIVVGLTAAPLPAAAAVGDVLRTVVLPAGEGPEGEFCISGIGTSVAVVPGASVGLPQEPILLVTSCAAFGSEAEQAQASQLFFFRPSAGTTPADLVLTVTTVAGSEITFPFAPPGGWGALALRTDKGDLIACGNKVAFSEDTSTHGIYRIPLSKTFATTEFPTTIPVKLFDGQPGYDDRVICDGIAWDTVENRIYQSPDIFHTVFRFTEAGVLAGLPPTVTVPTDCNPIVLGESTVGGNSGVAVSGQSLYLGCADDPQIFRVDKNTGAVLEVFGSPQLRSEDLECDPVTFAAQQKDALWTKGASDNNFIAIEVARGTCGGAVPVAGGPLCSKPDGTPDLTDTDGDGLLDCWERPSPLSAGAGGKPCIDFDGDGICDLVLCVDSGDGRGTVCADPFRKDVFLEIDWLESHRPNQFAINRVINRFDVAPVDNPVNPATGTRAVGIRLHVQLDEPLKDASGTVIPHNAANAFANGLLAFEPYTSSAGAGVLDFDLLKQNNFGTADQRPNPKAIGGKRQTFRYMISGHLLSGLGGQTGAAEVYGNDGVVTLGAGSVVGGHAVGSEDQQAGTFLHEIGHLLGLRHGGGDFVGCKANYLSAMNYTRQLPGAPIPTTQWRATALDYSRSKRPDLDKGNLREAAGIGGVAGDVTAFGPGSGVVRTTAGAIDWNRNLSTDAIPDTILDLNKIVNSSGTLCVGDGTGTTGTVLEGFNDWANLKYDVRASLDIADGSRLSLSDKESELGFFQAPPGNPCTTGACFEFLTTTDEGLVDSDGDGIPDLNDPCPNDPNPACVEQSVLIDVKPGSFPNTVNLGAPGVLPVAILGSATFDATQVNPATVVLSGARVRMIGKNKFSCSVQDVNGDHFFDLLCQVETRQLNVPPDRDNVVVELTARTFANVSIYGEDTIRVVAR